MSLIIEDRFITNPFEGVAAWGRFRRVPAVSGARFGLRSGLAVDSLQYSGRSGNDFRIQSGNDRTDVLFFVSGRRPPAWH